MTMTSAFCCLRYAPNAYRMTRRAEAWFTALVWVAVVMQCILTVTARNHYTMDVVISAYLTPLLALELLHYEHGAGRHEASTLRGCFPHCHYHHT
jgi:hypothetical protein